MAARLPDAVEDELAAIEPHPTMTAYLARVYHRKIAQRLWAGSPQDSELADTNTLKWLHPGGVWAGRIAMRDQVMSGESWPATRSYLKRGQSAIPPVEHVADDSDEAWCRWGVESLERYDIERYCDESLKLRLARQPVGNIQLHLAEAARILERIWPEVAVENHFLVRCFVYIEGGRFRSASIEDILGAIFVGVAAHQTLASTFEMLLHEEAHQSLYLRMNFNQLVQNPWDITNHPLRPDPRPIKGALHAAPCVVSDVDWPTSMVPGA